MRTQFHWKVPLQASNGQAGDFPVSAFWSPEREGTVETVAVTARAMATYQAGGKMDYAVVGPPQLVGSDDLDPSGPFAATG